MVATNTNFAELLRDSDFQGAISGLQLVQMERTDALEAARAAITAELAKLPAGTTIPNLPNLDAMQEPAAIYALLPQISSMVERLNTQNNTTTAHFKDQAYAAELQAKMSEQRAHNAQASAEMHGRIADAYIDAGEEVPEWLVNQETELADLRRREEVLAEMEERGAPQAEVDAYKHDLLEDWVQYYDGDLAAAEKARREGKATVQDVEDAQSRSIEARLQYTTHTTLAARVDISANPSFIEEERARAVVEAERIVSLSDAELTAQLSDINATASRLVTPTTMPQTQQEQVEQVSLEIPDLSGISLDIEEVTYQVEEEPIAAQPLNLSSVDFSNLQLDMVTPEIEGNNFAAERLAATSEDIAVNNAERTA